jgi:hypothetical protein
MTPLEWITAQIHDGRTVKVVLSTSPIDDRPVWLHSHSWDDTHTWRGATVDDAFDAAMKETKP